MNDCLKHINDDFSVYGLEVRVVHQFLLLLLAHLLEVQAVCDLGEVLDHQEDEDQRLVEAVRRLQVDHRTLQYQHRRAQTDHPVQRTVNQRDVRLKQPWS